jgi:hypothetical protein
MRQLSDLVDQAIAERKPHDFFSPSIVVGFETDTQFVPSGKREKMIAELEALVQDGGEPLGLLGMRQTLGDNSVTPYHKIFAEHAGEEWVSKYFDRLLEAIAIQARLMGARVTPARNAESN